MATKVSAAHERARNEFLRERAAGRTPVMQKLAAKYGITVANLYRAQWYKDDIAARKQAAQPGEEK